MNPATVHSRITDILTSKSVSDTLRLNSDLDQFFGVIDIKVSSDNQDEYPELSNDALNTSYVDYFQILNRIPIGEELIDLGAGIGRGSLLSAFMNLTRVHSLEINPSRVAATQKALSYFEQEANISTFDLGTQTIPQSSNYYLYFPTGRVFYKIFRELLTSKTKVFVCEAHGDTREFIALYLNYISLIDEIELIMPRHHPYVESYQSLGLFELNSSPLDLPSWFLANFDSDKILKAKWLNEVEEEAYLFLRIKDFELIVYQKSIALRNTVSSRIYKEGIEIEIVEDEFLCKDPRLNNNFKRGDKVFSRGAHLFIETRLGQLEKLDSVTPDTAFMRIS